MLDPDPDWARALERASSPALVVAPLVMLCRKERLMGELRIGKRTLVVGVAIAVAITFVDATTIWGVLPL